MKDFNTIDEILDFAIESEQNAVNFYTGLTAKATSPQMKETFEQFAREEMSHKARIMKIKEEKVFEHQDETILDLKISDYVIKTETSAVSTYQDALVLAMQREKAAFKLYSKLAAKAESPELKKLFNALAQDEAKHKLRFELEYDEFVLRDN